VGILESRGKITRFPLEVEQPRESGSTVAVGSANRGHAPDFLLDDVFGWTAIIRKMEVSGWDR
jgi:hypothetical protein